jgi:hypothetical protein
MEIRHVEQFRATVFQPMGTREPLALRTTPVTAAVVGDALMAAVTTALDMTAERCGTATFDVQHGAPPRSRQRSAMLVAESLAEAAERIRHFQPRAGHRPPASGGYEIWRGCRHSVQGFQKTGGCAHLAGGDHQAPRRGAQVTMSEQQLDGAKVGARLQQMNRTGVAQGMRRNRFADPTLGSDLSTGSIDGEWRDQSVGPVAWKQPRARTGTLPVVS